MTPDDPLKRARALFDAQVEALDPSRAGRLRAARRTALAGHTASRTSRWWPAGGLVTAALALALVLPDRPMTSPGETTASTPAPSIAPDARGLAVAADLVDESTAELDEDAAFYAWLAEAPVGDASEPTSLTEGTLL